MPARNPCDKFKSNTPKVNSPGEKACIRPLAQSRKARLLVACAIARSPSSGGLRNRVKPILWRLRNRAMPALWWLAQSRNARPPGACAIAQSPSSGERAQMRKARVLGAYAIAQIPASARLYDGAQTGSSALPDGQKRAFLPIGQGRKRPFLARLHDFRIAFMMM